MRVKRHKAYKRLMTLYQFTFGFREPYQIIVDAGFCRSSAANHMNLDTQLARVLFGQTKQMVTNCVMAELKANTEDRTALAISRRMERRRCSHKQPVPGSECIAEIVGDKNTFNYCVASQDLALREKLRIIPGVPLLYERRSVLIVEPPSAATLAVAQKNERKKQTATGDERKHIKKALEAVKLENNNGMTAEEAVNARPNKRKRPKAPNPLACKKKTVKIQPVKKQENNTTDTTDTVKQQHSQIEDEGTKQRRHRKRKRQSSKATQIADTNVEASN
ncbi:Fcf1-domain-containing protein [Syncephalis fuscata]|nr:Fcf1-domain-containing protein [Syncephalis fuscata]